MFRLSSVCFKQKEPSLMFAIVHYRANDKNKIYKTIDNDISH